MIMSDTYLELNVDYLTTYYNQSSNYMIFETVYNFLDYETGEIKWNG